MEPRVEHTSIRPPRRAPGQPTRIGFLLLPDFTLYGFANAVEVLREANRALGADTYAWTTLSLDGCGVRASNGVEVPADASPGATSPLDMLFICADWDIETRASSTLYRWLQRLESEGCALGAISAGTYLLARADLIRGRRVTIHWESAPHLEEQFPDITPTRKVFEIDAGLYTCSGGTAVLDMFVAMACAEHGRDLGEHLKLAFQLERLRGPDDVQRSAPLAHLESRPRKLRGAIREMEASLESPVSPEAIAMRIGLTTRHLQRLFRTHTGVSPGRFYMDLRLRKARLLLQQTRMPVLEVAVAVGFSSHSHFSKRYRERFGRTPLTERATQPFHVHYAPSEEAAFATA